MKQHIYSSREEMIEDGVKDIPPEGCFSHDMIRKKNKFPDYPPCDKRVDADEIERSLRGTIEKRIKPEAQVDITIACNTILDECIDKLNRVSYLVKQMKDGLCTKKETEL